MQPPGWTAFGAFASVLLLLSSQSTARDLDWAHIQAPFQIWVSDCISRSNILYVTGRNDLRIFDISSRGDIRELGSTPTGSGQDLALLGSTLFQATYAVGLSLFDVSDPANPRFVTNLFNVSGSSAVAVSGNYVLANAGITFQVIDASNPVIPIVVGQTQIDGEINSIKVKENIAFVTAGISGLHLIDFQNKVNPQRIGGFSTSQLLGPVLVFGDLLFVGAQTGFYSFDASDPLNLRELSFTKLRIPVRDWLVEQGKLYVMSGSDLAAYDISDPSKITREHLIPFAHEMQALTIQNGTAFVGGFEQMEIISLTSIANPQSITNISRTGMAGADIAIRGNFAYVTDENDGLHIIDLSEAQLSATFTNQSSVATALGEEFAYLADLRRGITVVDVRDPGNPTQAGFYNSGRSQDVFLHGTHLYVASFTNDLLILDVTSPTQPAFVSQLPLPGWSLAVVVSDEIAYVSGGNGGLHLVDVRTNESPQLLSTITGAVRCAAVKQKTAYASLIQDKILVLDCSDPKNPRLTETLATREWPVGMTIDGNHLYVAELGGGVEVFDISDALAPRRVGGNSRYIVTRIAAAAERLYLATQGDGFTPAYKFKTPTIEQFSRTDSVSKFRVHGPPKVDAALEFSKDFIEWFEGATLSLGEAPSEVIHSSNVEAHQFYRLRVPSNLKRNPFSDYP